MSTAWVWQGIEILVRKKSDQAGTEQFTSLVDTAVYTRYAQWRSHAMFTHLL